jgi:predicted nicotinamide N-methyase
MSRKVVVTFNNRDEVIKLRLDEVFDSIESLKFIISRELSGVLAKNYHLEFLDRRTGRFVPLDDTNISMISSSSYTTLLVIDESPVSNDDSVLCIDGRAFDISLGLPIGPKDLPIIIGEEDTKAQLGTGLVTWDGAVVLAKYLDKHRDLVHDRSVLELGAGTGLSGIATAVLGASRVLLTDLEYTVENLRRNIDLNAAVITASKQHEDIEVYETNGAAIASYSSNNIDVAVLDWANKSTYSLGPHDVRTSSIIDNNSNINEDGDEGSSYGASTSDRGWDLVIGADIVWLEELVPLLVRALEGVCSENTLVLLSHQVRELWR